jgi:hypothetical protein
MGATDRVSPELAEAALKTHQLVQEAIRDQPFDGTEAAGRGSVWLKVLQDAAFGFLNQSANGGGSQNAARALDVLLGRETFGATTHELSQAEKLDHLGHNVEDCMTEEELREESGQYDPENAE